MPGVSAVNEKGWTVRKFWTELNDHAPAGWSVTLCDPESGAQAPLGRHAGLPGLLRRLREDLAPGAPAGRLVIGAQPLLGRDLGGR